MARVEIPAPGDLIMDEDGNVQANVTVSLKLAGTVTDATHYSALTGGTSTTGGLKTGADGTIVDGSGNRRYVDSGVAMDLTIAGGQRQLEPLSASADDRARMPLNIADPSYGAVAGSASDQTAAIQAAIDALPSGGGEIYLPAGDYVVNTGLVWPVGKPVKLRGAGNGGSGNIFGTRLKRTSGTTTLITATGTGTAASQRAYIELENMELSGGALGGQIIEVSRASHLRFNKIRIARSTVTGATFKEVWDSETYGVIIETCGNGETNPAMVFDAVTGVGDQGGCATFYWYAPVFQGNTGTDVRLTGSTGDGAPSNDVRFFGPKLEGRGTGSPDAYPYVDFDYAQNSEIVGGRWSMPTSRNGLFIKQNGTSNGTRSNKITGGVMDMAGVTVPTYYVDHGQGTLDLVGVRMVGTAPSTGYVRIRSTVSAGRHHIKGCAIPTGAVPRIVDERTINERLDKGSAKWTRVGGTATNGLIGTTQTFDFDQTTLEDAYGNVVMPPDAVPATAVIFRLLWAANATSGAVYWRVISQASFAAGDATGGAGTNYNVTTTTPGTANLLAESTVTGPTADPGETLQVYLQRNAADVADTLAVDARLLALEVIYEKVI